MLVLAASGCGEPRGSTRASSGATESGPVEPDPVEPGAEPSKASDLEGSDPAFSTSNSEGPLSPFELSVPWNSAEEERDPRVPEASRPVFSPDGRGLAWIRRGRGFRLVLGSDEGPPRVDEPVDGGITALAWDPAGLRWLTGDRRGRLGIWPLPESGATPASSPELEIRLAGLEGSVGRVAWTSEKIAASSGGRIWLWEADGRRLVAAWAGHDRELLALAFRQDGHALVSADAAGGLRIWAPSGRLLRDVADAGFDALAAVGHDPYGWVLAWGRSAEGWGLWREAGGWWRPADGAGAGAAEVSAAVAGGGSRVVWVVDGRARELRPGKEEEGALRPVEGARHLTLSADGSLLAWVGEDGVSLRRLAPSIPPAAVHP